MAEDLETRLEAYAKEFTPRAADFGDALAEIRRLKEVEKDRAERSSFIRRDNERLRRKTAILLDAEVEKSRKIFRLEKKVEEFKADTVRAIPKPEAESAESVLDAIVVVMCSLKGPTDGDGGLLWDLLQNYRNDLTFTYGTGTRENPNPKGFCRDEPEASNEIAETK